MNKITRNTRAKGAAKAWYDQYLNGYKASLRVPSQKERDIHSQLVALGESPSPESVTEIIGNDSWVSVKCDECGSDCDAVIEVGQVPDYDSSTAHVCQPCLAKALELVIAN